MTMAPKFLVYEQAGGGACHCWAGKLTEPVLRYCFRRGMCSAMGKIIACTDIQNTQALCVLDVSACYYFPHCTAHVLHRVLWTWQNRHHTLVYRTL